MATAKTTTLTFRIELELKEVLHTGAERKRRSIANMVVMLIMDYYEKYWMPWEYRNRKTRNN